MSVVAEIAQRVAVMYAGQVMEEGAAATLFDAPQHPYTKALLNARPESRTGDRLATIPGTVPSLYNRPAGCLFAPRCGDATPHARDERPSLRPWRDGSVRCHYPLGDETRNDRIEENRRAGQDIMS
jgi:dipeptide transport system ATP-binding protein